jgi:archaeal type IV pilus assembly protein PilA
MNFKRLMNNRKGISPIFATLILIAIAVIAGVVVYMFVSGSLATMTGGGPAAQEKVSIQAASNTAADEVTVYAQASAGSVTIDSALLKDSSGAVVDVASAADGDIVPATIDATLTSVVITFPTANSIDTGSAYTVTLVSTKGGSFVSTSFTGQ